MGFICTTSKADAWICERLCRSLLSHRLSGVPLRYMALPLSAMIMPYFFNALRITCRFAEYGVTSKFALSLNRIPIGTGELELLPAQCDAGGTIAAWLCGKVNRIACWIFPAATSS